MTEVRGQMTEENRRVEQSSAAAISAGIEASPTFFFLIFRQDLPDNSGLFIILSHFPDGSEKTQSAWRKFFYLSILATFYLSIKPHFFCHALFKNQLCMSVSVCG